MKKTKIICTVGPATDSRELLLAMAHAGMNAARLNFSHGNLAEHKARIDLIKSVRGELQQPIAILLDTKGPEIRLGSFQGGGAELVKGQEFTLTTEPLVGNNTRSFISYKELPVAVRPGSRILIADGLIELLVIAIDGKNVRCSIVNGGMVTDRKNVNLPGVTSQLPTLTKQDVKDLRFGIEQDVDFIAASFVRKAADVHRIREVLLSNGGSHIGIIAKIENQEGVDRIDEILACADGIMVARGDLGVELPPENMPMVQKFLIKKANDAGKPVITATQMLESMIVNPRPTRAEVTDIANSILDGTDGIMLSGETAIGRYPLEAVRTMAIVASKTEETIDFGRAGLHLYDIGNISLTDAVCHAASTASMVLSVTAILAPTNTGYTARQLSKFRPKAPILGAVYDERTARRLCLNFGVEALKIPLVQNTDELIAIAIITAKKRGYVKYGDTVVICAGIPSGQTSQTNMMKVEIVT